MIGVDTAKDALFGRLKIAEPGPGYVHFPAADGFEEACFDQLTAEEVVTRHREGRPYRVWVLPKGRRNEALDTFVLALAARMSLPRALERQVEFTVEAPLPPSEPPAPRAEPPASQPRVHRGRGSLRVSERPSSRRGGREAYGSGNLDPGSHGTTIPTSNRKRSGRG